MENKRALLIIDIQNDYFEGGSNPLSGSAEAVSNVQKLLQHYRSNSLPVVHIQHISTGENATFFLPGTKGAEIHGSVNPLKKEDVIIKHAPNSFVQTNLDKLLRAKGITDLAICGMMTHMCIDATTRAAKDLNYKCLVIEDACATKDLEFHGFKVKAEKVQAAFLAALASIYASVISTEEHIKSGR